MATAAEIKRLRRDIGANEVSLPEDEALDLFAESAESYTEGTAEYYAHTRVLAIQGLLASSAKLTTYRQNQSSENKSDVFNHLLKLLALWDGKLDTAIADAATGSSARASKRLSKIREYPGS